MNGHSCPIGGLSHDVERKWTAVSFFALTAVAAGSFAFAGCTVTSSNPPDTEGGVGNPPVDGGSGDSLDVFDSAVATKCEGNNQTGGDLFSAACQSKLNTLCCAELKGCFNLTVTANDAWLLGGTDNCDKYSACIDLCTKKADGTPETDTGQDCRV